MSLSKVRSALIIVIFYGYVAIMLSVIVLWVKGGFDFDEFTTTVAIIAPLLASHIAVIIAFAVKAGSDKKDTNSNPIPGLNVAIVMTPPIALILLLLFSIYGKGFNFISITFEQFKVLIAIINSMFGAYVASLVGYYIKGQQTESEMSDGDPRRTER